MTTNKIESNGEFNKTNKIDLPKTDVTSLKIEENNNLQNIENQTGRRSNNKRRIREK